MHKPEHAVACVQKSSLYISLHLPDSLSLSVSHCFSSLPRSTNSFTSNKLVPLNECIRTQQFRIKSVRICCQHFTRNNADYWHFSNAKTSNDCSPVRWLVGLATFNTVRFNSITLHWFIENLIKIERTGLNTNAYKQQRGHTITTNKTSFTSKRPHSFSAIDCKFLPPETFAVWKFNIVGYAW